jgi:hypothetical protein
MAPDEALAVMLRNALLYSAYGAFGLFALSVAAAVLEQDGIARFLLIVAGLCALPTVVYLLGM